MTMNMKISMINSNKKSYTNNTVNFKSKDVFLTKSDFLYKSKIKQGLNDTFNLQCELKDLTSIATPIEIRSLLKKLKPQNYTPGELFRANFHMHTDASDGKMSVTDCLEQCVDWANYLFKKGSIDDNLPYFSAAITDHDTAKNSKKAIEIISQAPDKYKNIKFLTGCEFLFHEEKQPKRIFEAVGLGFNPFEANLDGMFKGFSSYNKLSDIPKVKRAGGILSWAHPYNSLDKCNDDFFNFLKNNGIDGVENNYQYQYLATTKFKQAQEYTENEKLELKFYQDIETRVRSLAKKYGMLESGGTDSHGKTIRTGPFGE